MNGPHQVAAMLGLRFPELIVILVILGCIMFLHFRDR